MSNTIIKMPSREEVRLKLGALSQGSLSPQSAAQWAAPWKEEEEGYEKIVKDFVVWSGLNDLYGAYAFDLDATPLYNELDFKEWLKKFEDACLLSPLPGEQPAIERPRKRVAQSSLQIQFPTRSAVHTKLKALANGSLGPNSASFWAMRYIMELDENDLDLEDSALSLGLRRLYWADMPSIESSRKFTHTDYAQWLQEFEAACAQNPIKE